jgi:hypothetical protein
MAAEENSSTQPLTPYENEIPTPSIATPSRIKFNPNVPSSNGKIRTLKKTFSNYMQTRSNNKNILNQQIQKFKIFKVELKKLKTLFNNAITKKDITIAKNTYSKVILFKKMMEEHYDSLNNNAKQYNEFIKLPRKVKQDTKYFEIEAKFAIKKLEIELAKPNNDTEADTDIENYINVAGGRRRTRRTKRRHNKKRHTKRRR